MIFPHSDIDYVIIHDQWIDILIVMKIHDITWWSIGKIDCNILKDN